MLTLKQKAAIIEQIKKGKSVTVCPKEFSVSKEKAKQLFLKYKSQEGSSFNASSGWFQKWKRRFGIRLITISGEKLAADPGPIEPLKKKLEDKIAALQLTTQQIYNVDETALFWKLLPKKTYVSFNEKSAFGGKIPKQRVTLLLGSNATGTHKLVPMIIGKSKNPRCLKNFEMPIEYKSSMNAWMTKYIFKEWFFKSFVVQVKKHCEEQNLPLKALLIIDNAPCHPSAEELRYLNGDICTMFLPPNVTALVQPLDQNGIRITKLHYKSNLLSLVIALPTKMKI
ncbi:tigger transposable element-derived protein 1-like [Episyrphus balteatus]|uniref:tigger transposable element-derived protein 1-like n=1 Tax=Episyrphus balteatus TaxID=286459 RepID=UPI0024853835|nr:tigger transposable element-derived protein 1-like [Episyrphus balteatus]